MPVLRNIRALAQCRRDGAPNDVQLIPDAALAWEGERISWVGPERNLPQEYSNWTFSDAERRLVIPGLIDCHTHLAFGGWRAGEFARRLAGATYLEIAAAGGGIASTVAQTRASRTDELVNRCQAHLAEMGRLGVTTVEAKSGYGLSLREELRLLRVYRELSGGPQRIVPTLLAAHVVPKEFVGRREEYVKLIVESIIPHAAGEHLARFCDVFVEDTAFTVDEARRILEAGKRHDLMPKLHADQITSCGGAELAASVGAVSADHLEQISEAGIAAMAAAGVVAVSLPFATLSLGGPPLPARKLLDAGVPVAVATDFNPGTAPSYHLPVAMWLACSLQRMTPAEVLRGATIVAAQALGLAEETGSLEAGKSADFAIIDAESVDQWLYHLRPNACVHTTSRGYYLS